MDLKPIKIPTLEWEEIEAKIKEAFKREIYIPLLKEIGLPKKTFKNSQDALIEAIKSGRVTFSRGVFSGKFNSEISKALRDLGAKFNRRKGTYNVLLNELPIDLRGVISASEFTFLNKIKKIDQFIASIVPEKLAEKLKMDHLFDRSLWKVQKSYEASVKAITVPPQLTDKSAKWLQREWRDNMNLSIKGVLDEVLPKLRKEIQASVYQGNRYGALEKTLQDSYGLSASRAKYVARNETNLMMSKFKEVRLAEVGVHKYRWQSVIGTTEHPVRQVHKDLTERSKKGEIFDFRTPPIAEATGERYNPHSRNNCRCTAVPYYEKETG